MVINQIKTKKGCCLVLLILAMSFSVRGFGQTIYKGFIGVYPIELVIDDFYGDKEITAVYSYKKFCDPIPINGEHHKDSLILYEKDKNCKTSAILLFDKYDKNAKIIEGTWKNLSTKKELKITLKKDYEIEDAYADSIEWKNREILQPVSLEDYYFKVVTSKEKNAYGVVTGVKIFQKGTGQLVQTLKADECEIKRLNSIYIGDFNFDGIEDFSLFQSHAGSGPNTSFMYFLFNPNTKKFFDSKFGGTSLEFDSKRKRIYEMNSCCAGHNQTTAEYKVVNNKMVLLEEHCWIWDEKKQDMVERKMKDCR